MDSYHEVNELMQKHQAMLETNNLHVIYIQRQRLLEFGDQEAKIQTVLDLQEFLVENLLVLVRIYEFSKEYFWLRVDWENLNEFFIEYLRFFINQLLDFMVVYVFQQARYSDTKEQIIAISEFELNLILHYVWLIYFELLMLKICFQSL